ncbi:hypothetical protein HYX13_00830 [Candidatus Woesearchaeota archaeon]|nr:hypothetical protein [Candidatus Woesearchaeota archaeon]
MIGFAKEKIKIDPKYFSNDDATILSSYNQQFSTIICCNLFFYLTDYQDAITRWKELLAEKGKIILIEENPFIFPKSKSVPKMNKKLSEVIRPKSISQIKEIFFKEGLNIIQEEKVKIDKCHQLCGLVFEK